MNDWIVLGLSDGVDSAVSAALLKRQGLNVLGVFLDTGNPEALQGAMQSAREAGIGFERVDIERRLDEEICLPFLQEYLRGRTPMPCTLCNRQVKLPALLEAADRLGIKNVATGHYVRREGDDLYMGHESCDQSYMLCLLSPSQVKRLILPLGAFSKAQVRAMAKELGLSCADKPDSRENCFIREGDYASWIEKRASALPGGGDVLYQGQVIGRHDGLYRWTVGQRWPSDIGPRRAYVKRLDAASNTIELCLWEALFTQEVRLEKLSFLAGQPPAGEFDALIRARHTRWEQPECRVELTGDGARVHTLSPLRAPAPGQTAALYDGQRLLGGGTIV